MHLPEKYASVLQSALHIVLFPALDSVPADRLGWIYQAVGMLAGLFRCLQIERYLQDSSLDACRVEVASAMQTAIQRRFMDAGLLR